MTSADTLQALFKNDRESFLDMLNSVILLDIGTIDSIDENGRATVSSSTFIDNRPIKYTDAEVIYPGNANGTFASACSGMACLIFLPKSCLPKVSDLKLRVGATSYNRDGVKVMPIGNGAANKVKAYFNGGGDFSILTDTYGVSFSGDTVSFQLNNGKTTLTIDGTGQMYVSRQTDTGTLYINIEDTGITKQWLSQNKDVLWTDTLNPDGSRTLIQKDNNDTTLASITIAADGTIDVTGKEINLNGDSKHLVTYAELKDAMDKLWFALTNTPIAGNGSTQPTWTGISGIDISASETTTVQTGG